VATHAPVVRSLNKTGIFRNQRGCPPLDENSFKVSTRKRCIYITDCVTAQVEPTV